MTNTKLRTARLTCRLTQREVAREAGVSLRTVVAAEHGARPSLRTQRVLANALERDPEELFPVAELLAA